MNEVGTWNSPVENLEDAQIRPQRNDTVTQSLHVDGAAMGNINKPTMSSKAQHNMGLMEEGSIGSVKAAREHKLKYHTGWRSIPALHFSISYTFNVIPAHAALEELS